MYSAPIKVYKDFTQVAITETMNIHNPSFQHKNKWGKLFWLCNENTFIFKIFLTIYPWSLVLPVGHFWKLHISQNISKDPITWGNFSCNLQCNSTLGRCNIDKYIFPSQVANIFLTHQKLHCATGS